MAPKRDTRKDAAGAAGRSAEGPSHSSLTVESWPIERVIPYARNPRKNAGAVAKVAASLREFGWRQPIVVDEGGTVIAGHTRLLAAQQLGMTEVPVHVAAGLTPQQAKAYRIADNRTGEEAEWDFELLALELTDLKDAGFDLALTGFDAEETNGRASASTVREVESSEVFDRFTLVVRGSLRDQLPALKKLKETLCLEGMEVEIITAKHDEERAQDRFEL